MNDLLLISGIIIFIVGIMLIWNWKSNHRANMAKRQERKQEEEEEKTDYDDSQPHFEDDTVSLPNDGESLVTEPVKSLDDEVTPTKNSPDTAKNQPSPKKSELITALFVVAQKRVGFAGADIFSVLEELGLKYGEMGIFHHYGIGEIKTQQAVFSIANMLEPGTFDPQVPEFNSPGLALFMRLPGPFGGRVAFELMLNNGQRMADMLEGLLVDEKHASITQKTIADLRTRIANFEQRSPGLAMLKSFS